MRKIKKGTGVSRRSVGKDMCTYFMESPAYLKRDLRYASLQEVLLGLIFWGGGFLL